MHALTAHRRSARVASSPPRGTAPSSGLLLPIIACLSLQDGLIHMWYTAESFMEWWGYGAFFLGAALGQSLYAPVLLRWPTPLVALTGIWANAGIVGLYVVTRIWGIPLGPHVEVVESVGLLDLVAAASETALVVLLVTVLDGRRRRITVNALMVLGLMLWILRLAEGGTLR